VGLTRESAAGSGTVLVVDDSAARRHLMASWLSRGGFAVVEAETGAQALARIDDTPVDLVVLDIRLPGLTGCEVYERIKADTRRDALPVIGVSAHPADVTDRDQGPARGADAYLAEPIEPAELVATAYAVLRHYRTHRPAELLADRLARLRADRAPRYVAVPASAPVTAAPVLPLLARAVATAAEARRCYDEEHRIAVTLQRGLLPGRMPDVAGIEIAVRYQPASAQTEVGGDFYELSMVDGRLLVAIGDVAGHSLHAATVMAELRHGVRAYAVEGHQPGAMLERADELLRVLLPGELATICLLLLEPTSGRVRLASAGHLPPLVVHPDRAEFLQHRAPLLGVGADRPADLEFGLAPGATLLLYTDGLIERRAADIDDGLRRLATCAGRVDADLERYCDRLLSELAAPEIRDDIAVVALRRSLGPTTT